MLDRLGARHTARLADSGRVDNDVEVTGQELSADGSARRAAPTPGMRVGCPETPVEGASEGEWDGTVKTHDLIRGES